MTNQTIILHCYNCGNIVEAKRLDGKQCVLTCTGCNKVITISITEYVKLLMRYADVKDNPLHITILEPPDTTWTLNFKGYLIHISKGNKFYVQYKSTNGKFKTYSSKYLHAVKTFIDRRL